MAQCSLQKRTKVPLTQVHQQVLVVIQQSITTHVLDMQSGPTHLEVSHLYCQSFLLSLQSGPLQLELIS